MPFNIRKNSIYKIAPQNINSKQAHKGIMKNNAHKRRSKRIHDAIQTDADVSICKIQIPGVVRALMKHIVKIIPSEREKT